MTDLAKPAVLSYTRPACPRAPGSGWSQLTARELTAEGADWVAYPVKNRRNFRIGNHQQLACAVVGTGEGEGASSVRAPSG